MRAGRQRAGCRVLAVGRSMPLINDERAVDVEPDAVVGPSGELIGAGGEGG